MRKATLSLIALLALLALPTPSAQAQAVTVLYSFSSGTDGANPDAGLLRDKAGNLYGTTANGGPSGVGTVLKLDTSGNETVLHSFMDSDGATPLAGLVMDKAGNLYGTTIQGGSSNNGTVFKVDTSGNTTVLHSFMGFPTDAAYPILAGLIMDKAGNLYGTTLFGGSSGGRNRVQAGHFQPRDRSPQLHELKRGWDKT